MWEIFLATVVSLSVGVREPRNVSTAPFDYELSYLLNNTVLFKEDYKQIASKDLYQFNSDIRYQWKGFSAGYGFIWDLKDNRNFKLSAGYSKKLTLDKWELETENDIYYTKPLTYQTEAKVVYNITNNIGIGLSGNYIETLNDYDYSAKAVITIKLGEAK
jgi:hypothetical protein